MKIILLVICIVFAGCGGKTNEDIAKDLVKEKLKTTLPDYNNYESVNFGALGMAFLPYEETDQYIVNSRALKDYKDSITVLEKLVKENKVVSTDVNDYKKRLQQLMDSSGALNARNNEGKQAYTPEKLFKISHAYKIKDKSGLEKKTEDEFYFDKDLKRVVKVHKVY